ncbi:PREDICTED: polygalacturonase-like [Erythranthe guttata]|uniref:polygalacturonase-like n=1 Tax=Erythranthe guttata TaxID=4155 RepID=UPI00064DBB8F|nr:PREDICTED: polygalacturonase-like [Erythranthe guttata]|eukprot:XP_012829368.1 PREDICTED: polygalacturonase-like [Erythranthe guttata]
MSKVVPFSCKLFLVAIAVKLCTSTAYNVVDFGARGDGKTDSTSSFLKAWNAACNSVVPTAVIIVPRGTFLVKSISFTGPCKSNMKLLIHGTLIAPNDYRFLGSNEFWIMFYRINGLSIFGGAIDAKGSSLWSCKSGGNNCPYGARCDDLQSISFQSCNNVLVSGLKSFNSQRVHISINGCWNMFLQKMKIVAPSRSPNTDGIHIESSTGITISNSNIGTGDDCISVGPGSMKLRMDKISCGPGHGIRYFEKLNLKRDIKMEKNLDLKKKLFSNLIDSIGSLGRNTREHGVQDVNVTNSIFVKTENGVRVKSWPRASDGYAKNLLFKNLVMKNVSNPIIIDQDYCPHQSCSPKVHLRH